MRELLRFRRCWLAVTLTFALFLCVGLLIIYLARKHQETVLAHEDFLEKYEALKEGVTEEEVEAILGPHAPDGPDAWPGGSLGPHECFWYRGKDAIYVCFHPSMSEKRFDWGIVDKAFLTKGKQLRRTTYGRWNYGVRFRE